jgi:hypothetical protein
MTTCYHLIGIAPYAQRIPVWISQVIGGTLFRKPGVAILIGAATTLIAAFSPVAAHATVKAPVGAPVAAQAAGKVVLRDHPCCQYPWSITSVSSAYDTTGSWFDCLAIVDNDGTNDSWTCNSSYATGNSVTGTVNVSDGTISAAVGFNVTLTFTRGTAFTTSPGSDWYGELEAANVYSTKTVYEEQEQCYLTPPLDCIDTGTTAQAYANQWISWTYRKVQSADD